VKINSYGNIITSTTDFAAFWTILATEFADNELVIFDTSTFHSPLLTIYLSPFAKVAGY
jgi:endoglucanase